MANCHTEFNKGMIPSISLYIRPDYFKEDVSENIVETYAIKNKEQLTVTTFPPSNSKKYKKPHFSSSTSPTGIDLMNPLQLPHKISLPEIILSKFRSLRLRHACFLQHTLWIQKQALAQSQWRKIICVRVGGL